MCGMDKMKSRKDFTSEELKKILEDKLFSKVTSVGVNGGEPFIKDNIEEYMEVIVNTLPKLEVINIISNGYLTDNIILKLSNIKRMCKSRNIKVNLSISVDGVDDMQDFHRGKSGAFLNVNNTIEQILKSPQTYVDYLDVICTITKYNIARINEVEVWAKKLGVQVEYNIATVNERIENKDKDFLVFEDEQAKMLATEFFYNKYRETQKEKYFSIYLFLRYQKRFSDCPCMYNEWITVTPDGNIGFCATHSKGLGSGIEESPYDIVNRNKKYLKQIKRTYCGSCSHYSYMLNEKGLKILYKNKKANMFMR
jgi:MoaA/NifB/PqqE/SkfB family radical SAM enzyme